MLNLFRKNSKSADNGISEKDVYQELIDAKSIIIRGEYSVRESVIGSQTEKVWHSFSTKKVETLIEIRDNISKELIQLSVYGDARKRFFIKSNNGWCRI